ncbi:MAG: hypothetical protein RR295_10620, partial [Oscillospiraceae bacterium]
MQQLTKLQTALQRKKNLWVWGGDFGGTETSHRSIEAAMGGFSLGLGAPVTGLCPLSLLSVGGFPFLPKAHQPSRKSVPRLVQELV